MDHRITCLKVWLVIRDDRAVLDRLEFTHEKLPRSEYPCHTARLHRGRNGFQWQQGTKALVAFLIHARLAALCGMRHSFQPFTGPRPSIASTLNDLITSPPDWIGKAFGERTRSPMFCDLVDRTNGDFKNDRDGTVRIWLLDEMCPGTCIHIFREDTEVNEETELEHLLEDIRRQWRLPNKNKANRARSRKVTKSLKPDSVDWWQRRIEQLEAATDYGDADEQWGHVNLELLRLAAHPELEEQLEGDKRSGRWGALIASQIKQRRGRWTHIFGLLDPLLQKLQGSLQTGSDAVWFGRATAMVAMAAHREQNRQVVREHFAALHELAFDILRDSTALRAHCLHYQGRVLMDDGASDEARACLVQSRELYDSLDATSPWRLIGLSQVSDTLGQFYVERSTAQQARELFEQSIENKRSIGDLYGQAITYGKLGRMYSELNELDQAEEYLQRDLDLCDRMHDRRNKAVVLLQLADTCLLRAEGKSETTGALNRASGYLDQARRLAGELRNDVLLAMIDVARARRLVTESGGPHRGSAATLTRAEQLAADAESRLRKARARADLTAQARLWHGWAKARRAMTENELRQVDKAHFIPAIAELADRPIAAAEAHFQRARMLSCEGTRVGYSSIEETVDCFANAVETAHALGAKGLAQRFVNAAQGIQSSEWIQLARRYRQTVASLTRSRQQLQLELEQQFASAMLFAHDLGNPLYSLRSIIPNDSSRDPAWDKAEVQLERLEAIHEMMELMEQIRDLTAGNGLDNLSHLMKEQDIVAVVRRVAQRVERMYRHCGVRLDGPSGPAVEFRTVGIVLEQILHNLIDNAVRAAATADKKDRLVSIDVRREGSLVVEVCNSGKPLSADEADRIFQPGQGSLSGYQRESKHRGLYVSREFARRLNGDITMLVAPRHLMTAFQLRLEPVSNVDNAAQEHVYSR